MKQLLMQAVHFVGLSGLGWILDFCTYTVLRVVSDNLFFNNTVSSWVGVTFVFIFATRKVFQNNSKIPLKYKYLIYLLYQCILILFISKLLATVNSAIIEAFKAAFIMQLSSIIAKIFVTPITMVLNFFFMKAVIEKI